MPTLNLPTPSVDPPDVWGDINNDNLTAINTAVDDHETRIDTLEAGGGLPAGWYLIDTFAGATDTAKMEAAIAAAVAAGKGTVLATNREYEIASRVIIPAGVNLWGAGTGKAAEGNCTRFLMTAAGAGIRFGDIADLGAVASTDATRGGLSGNFEVHGGDVATDPLQLYVVVHRTFGEMDVRNAAAGGAGCTLNHVQNSIFIGLTVDDCAGDGLVLDTSSNGNTFITPRIAQCGTAAGTNLANLKFTCTGPSLFGAGLGFPQNNTFINAMTEINGGNLAAQVWLGAGIDNYISGNLTCTGSEAAVRTNNDNPTDAGVAYRLHMRDLNIVGAGTAGVPAFDLADNTHLYIDAGCRVFNFSSLYRLRGTAAFVTHTAAIEEQTIGSTLHASSVGTHAGSIFTYLRTRLQHYREAASDGAVYYSARSDGGFRLELRADGSLNYGDGSGFTPDVSVGRVAANVFGTLDDGDSLKAGSGAWNAGHIQMGTYHLWIDSTGDLRIKSSAPASDTDGAVVGTQS